MATLDYLEERGRVMCVDCSIRCILQYIDFEQQQQPKPDSHRRYWYREPLIIKIMLSWFYLSLFNLPTKWDNLYFFYFVMSYRLLSLIMEPKPLKYLVSHWSISANNETQIRFKNFSNFPSFLFYSTVCRRQWIFTKLLLFDLTLLWFHLFILHANQRL